MAHAIDQTTGKAAFVSFAAPGWHGLGKTFEREISTEEGLNESGQNFTVLKLPNIHPLPNEQEIISDSSFFTCRTDTNKVLGDRLGKDYTVLQNAEAFAFVDEILQSGTAKIETAGALFEGRKTFICLKVNRDILVKGSDVVKQYILITNAHDGSGAIIVMQTNVRVVCANTLAAALGAKSKGDRFSIRHTANAKDRVKDALKVLQLIRENEEVNAANYNRMADLVISKQQMFDYFGNIFLDEAEIKELQSGKKLAEVASKQKQNTLAEVLYFAQKGVGQADTMKGPDFTTWSAYNAVTGVITRKRYSSADDRANSMLFGTAAQQIQTAGALALTPEKIKPLSRQSSAGNFGLN